MPTTGADLLVASLIAQEVDTIFTLPGLQLDPIFDALAKRRDEFTIIHVRNEQAAAYMADGYARVTGKPACCLVVPGPGLLNAMAGLSTAYACSAPVLCVAGQIPSSAIGKDLGLLHEINDQLGTIRAVTTWSGRAMEPAEIPRLVDQAMAEMMTGRTRPVSIEISPDVLARHYDGQVELPRSPIEPVAVSSLAVAEAARLIAEGRTPLIVAGGGAVRSNVKSLAALSDRLGAPVIMTTNGKGAVSARHDLAFEAPAMRLLLPRADVVIAVGTRFAQRNGTRWVLRPDQRLIKIDIDKAELDRAITPTVAIEGDAEAVTRALLDKLERPAQDSTWGDLSAVRAELDEQVRVLKPQSDFGQAIRDALPDDAVVIDGMNQVGYWCRIAFPVYEARTFISTGYQGTLGFELPTGLGAKIGKPDSRVVVIAGDGGIMFNIGELATAAQHGIAVVTLIFNDGAFGNVQRTQDDDYGGRRIASDLKNPDFVKLAESFGISAHRVTDPDALRECLVTVLAQDVPAVIEIPVGRMPDPWPLIVAH